MSTVLKTLTLTLLITSPLNAGVVAPPPEIDAKADKTLRQMAKFYASLKSVRFQATLELGYEVQGKARIAKRAFNIAAQRPNKLLVKPASSIDSRSGRIYADGKKLYIFSPQLDQYTEDETPDQLDQILDHVLIGPLTGGVVPQAGAVLRLDPYSAIVERLDGIKYLGRGRAGGKSVHRVQVDQAVGRRVFWIAVGEQPWIMKIQDDLSGVESLAKKAGQTVKMSRAIVFSNWKTADKIDAKTFKFKKPDTAKHVASFFDAPKSDHAQLGRPAANFTLKQLDGKPVELLKLKQKKIVVLDFWATWCGPCVRAMPVLADVTKKFKDKDVVFYAVNQREAKAEIQKFLKRSKLDINVLLDTDGAVGAAYGVQGIPQTVIIGKDGTVQAVHVGFSPDLEKNLTNELKTLISGKKLSK